MNVKALQEAIISGDLPAVQEIVDQNPSLVNEDDEYAWRPIFHAGLRRHLDIVRYLINQGADLSTHDGYVMHYAGEVPNNKEVVSLLVQYGGLDAHTEPASPIARQFIHAVFLANVQRVHAMLRTHSDLVHERFARRDTALHHAARNGDMDMVGMLVAHGVDVNAMSEAGHFPLYCAAGHGHVDATRVLVENGADLATTINDQTTSEWLRQYTDEDVQYQACLEVLENASLYGFDV